MGHLRWKFRLIQIISIFIGIFPRLMERQYLENQLSASIDHGMALWLVSHGGVGTKSLAEHFEKQGIKTKTSEWHEVLVHAHRPATSVTRKSFNGAIYVYGDPILSICSMKRQGNARLNLMKLSDHSETGNEELQYQYMTAP